MEYDPLDDYAAALSFLSRPPSPVHAGPRPGSLASSLSYSPPEPPTGRPPPPVPPLHAQTLPLPPLQPSYVAPAYPHGRRPLPTTPQRPRKSLPSPPPPRAPLQPSLTLSPATAHASLAPIPLLAPLNRVSSIAKGKGRARDHLFEREFGLEGVDEVDDQERVPPVYLDDREPGSATLDLKGGREPVAEEPGPDESEKGRLAEEMARRAVGEETERDVVADSKHQEAREDRLRREAEEQDEADMSGGPGPSSEVGMSKRREVEGRGIEREESPPPPMSPSTSSVGLDLYPLGESKRSSSAAESYHTPSSGRSPPSFFPSQPPYSDDGRSDLYPLQVDSKAGSSGSSRSSHRAPSSPLGSQSNSAPSYSPPIQRSSSSSHLNLYPIGDSKGGSGPDLSLSVPRSRGSPQSLFDVPEGDAVPEYNPEPEDYASPPLVPVPSFFPPPPASVAESYAHDPDFYPPPLEPLHDRARTESFQRPRHQSHQPMATSYHSPPLEFDHQMSPAPRQRPSLVAMGSQGTSARGISGGSLPHSSSGSFYNGGVSFVVRFFSLLVTRAPSRRQLTSASSQLDSLTKYESTPNASLPQSPPPTLTEVDEESQSPTETLTTLASPDGAELDDPSPPLPRQNTSFALPSPSSFAQTNPASLQESFGGLPTPAPSPSNPNPYAYQQQQQQQHISLPPPVPTAYGGFSLPPGRFIPSQPVSVNGVRVAYFGPPIASPGPPPPIRSPPNVGGYRTGSAMSGQSLGGAFGGGMMNVQLPPPPAPHQGYAGLVAEASKSPSPTVGNGRADSAGTGRESGGPPSRGPGGRSPALTEGGGGSVTGGKSGVWKFLSKRKKDGDTKSIFGGN